MANPIPEALREILAAQCDETQLDKLLAQVFINGALVVFRPDGSKQVLPETVLDIGLDPSLHHSWTPIETPPGDWDGLSRRPPKQTEIAVFPGNFRRGTQGKHHQNT